MITAEHGREYHEQGFVVVRDFYTQTMLSGWVGECERLSSLFVSAQSENPRMGSRAHLTKGKIFDRLDPVIDLSPLFHDLAHDPRLQEVCAALLGEPATLFKDKLIAKPPGTFGYLVHQDHPYWEHVGIPADHMLTAWIAIDQTSSLNGALEIFPRMHRARLPGKPDAPLDIDESSIDTSTGIIVAMEPGDVLFFHPLAPHRSAPNRSDMHRRALLLTYVPARFEGLYEKYYRMKMH